jgi:hypothetical protein
MTWTLAWARGARAASLRERGKQRRRRSATRARGLQLNSRPLIAHAERLDRRAFENYLTSVRPSAGRDITAHRPTVATVVCDMTVGAASRN